MNKDKSKDILFAHNFQRDMITKALDIVKHFIINNKRILVGGMSIDMTLQLKGQQIYSSTTLPDYDFYSPEFHIDAYKLGEQLAKEFNNISIIRALHPSTMRVRINFVEVADISYIPQNIYDNLPTFKYQGFIVIHPHYQIIDQHRALSLPYENTPRETMLARWKKDIERYDLLYTHFPVLDVELPKFSTKEYNLSFDLLDGECLGGYVSFLYWLNSAKMDGFKDDNIFGDLIITEKNIKATLLEPMYFTIITDNFDDIFKKFTGEKVFYNSIVDKIPRKILIAGVVSDDNVSSYQGAPGEFYYEIIDNRGRLTSAYKPFSTKRIWISNLQDVMCYLLTLSVFYKSPLATKAYIAARELLCWASAEYVKSQDEKIRKYLPSIDIYGQYNWPESYLIERSDVMYRINKEKNCLCVPMNAYPAKNKPIQQLSYDFIPSKSKVYQFDGMITDKFDMRRLA